MASFTADNDGEFQFEDTIPGPVPCAIRADVGGRTEVLAVNKAPATCQ